MTLIRNLRFILSHPLNRSRKIAALRRYFGWQVGSRLVPGAVVCDWINGSRFIVSRGETGLTGNVYTGLHEFADMAFVLHCLRPGDLFVDVGANVGSYTILACAAVGADGIAFEPVPKTFRRLLDNVRLNGLETRVRCINKAAGATAGSVTFTTGLDTTNHVVADREPAAEGIDIETTTLDESLDGTAPFLLKIDVEGYEMPAIDGAERTLADGRLQAVIMELNGSGRRYGIDDVMIAERMRALGFQACSYEPFSRALVGAEPTRSGEGNVVFVRNPAAVAERLRTAQAFEVNGTLV